MTPTELGLVYNQLLERRTLYSFAMDGRNRTQDEQAAVRIIEAHKDDAEDLEEFLATQGLKLEILEAAALGRSVGRVYVALRDPLVPVPAHIGGVAMLRELSGSRRTDSQTESAAWGACLLLILLRILYTDEGRPVEAVSGCKDVVLDEAQYAEALLSFVESLRQSAPPEESQAAWIHHTLASAGEAQVEARAKRFLRAMCRVGVLEERPVRMRGAAKTEVWYAQTLWSAVDVSKNFARHAGALLDVTTAAVIAAVVTAPSAGESGAEPQEDDHVGA